MSLITLLRSPLDYGIGMFNTAVVANFDTTPLTNTISSNLTKIVEKDGFFSYAYGAGVITWLLTELTVAIPLPIILSLRHTNPSYILGIPSYFALKMVTRKLGRMYGNIFQDSRKDIQTLQNLV